MECLEQASHAIVVNKARASERARFGLWQRNRRVASTLIGPRHSGGSLIHPSIIRVLLSAPLARCSRFCSPAAAAAAAASRRCDRREVRRGRIPPQQGSSSQGNKGGVNRNAMGGEERTYGSAYDEGYGVRRYLALEHGLGKRQRAPLRWPFRRRSEKQEEGEGWSRFSSDTRCAW